MAELICPECQFENDSDSTFCEECGALLSESEPQEEAQEFHTYQPGESVHDRYEIVSILKESARDASYLAVDRESDGTVVWMKQRMEMDDVEEEFEKQEQLFNTLIKNRHKHVARVLNIFMENSYIFLVVENLEGQNLGDLMAMTARSFSQEDILDWAIQAAKGINFMHSNDILHLDIQPSHLFITDEGELKIIGFSRIAPIEEELDDFAVTEGYSPPEAYGLVGGKIDRQSDIYSLGASIYSLITGRTPKLSRENFFTFQPLNDTDVLIDPGFEKIIMKAVKKEPSDRFQNLGLMIKALKSLKQKPEPVKKEAPPAREMEFDITVKSHVGKVRSVNQDSCLASRYMAYEKSKPNFFHLMIVADGMGGEAEGDKASSLAIRVIAREVLDSFMPVATEAETMRLYSDDDLQDKSADILRRAVLKANQIVFDYSRQDHSRRGMGSTISAALIIKNNLCVCHAGDTRLYVFNRQFGLIQVTEDHSLVGRLVRLGQLTREEALRSPQRSAVYRALGTTPELDVDVYNYLLRPGDYLLICSDGVWEYFPDRELITIILEEGTTKKIADKILVNTLERGADDNATIIVAKSKGSIETSGTLRLDAHTKGLPEILEKKAEERRSHEREKREELRKKAEEKRLEELRRKQEMLKEEEKKSLKESLHKGAMDRRKREEMEKKRFEEEIKKRRLRGETEDFGPEDEESPNDIEVVEGTDEEKDEVIHADLKEIPISNSDKPLLIREVKMEMASEEPEEDAGEEREEDEVELPGRVAPEKDEKEDSPGKIVEKFREPDYSSSNGPDTEPLDRKAVKAPEEDQGEDEELPDDDAGFGGNVEEPEEEEPDEGVKPGKDEKPGDPLSGGVDEEDLSDSDKASSKKKKSKKRRKKRKKKRSNK